jgi:nitroreductase
VVATAERRIGFGEDHSKVAVLSTFDNDRLGVLQCGEMLSAVLLEATMAGLATCTLTHIIEQHAGTNLVAALIDQTTKPQVLVRVGVASDVEDPPSQTPRRPLDEVFHVRSNDH